MLGKEVWKAESLEKLRFMAGQKDVLDRFSQVRMIEEIKRIKEVLRDEMEHK